MGLTAKGAKSTLAASSSSTETSESLPPPIGTSVRCGKPSDGAFVALFRETGGLPRRINTLCGRVLLYGALEETHVVTAEMVEATAAELARDLGAGQPPPQAAPRIAVSEERNTEQLDGRIAALEQGVARQGRTLHRLVELIGAYAEPRP